MSETRSEREKRWAALYDAEVAKAKAEGKGPPNFQNWIVNKKAEERGS